MDAEIKNEDCQNFVVWVNCTKCGEFFDLSKDLNEVDCDVEEVLKEKCGSSELLCWKCRHCD